MAHELTHVLQQTPDLARTDSDLRPMPDRLLQRRVEYYSLPPLRGFGSPGGRTHEILQHALGRESGNTDLFFEINIPGGNIAGTGAASRGRSDLYRSSPTPHTIGVHFETGTLTPELLPAHTDARRGNGRLGQREHRKIAAPIGNRGAPAIPRICPRTFTADPGICRMDEAPSEIRVGDIKPVGERERLLGSYNQIPNYITGIHGTRDRVNAFNAANPTSFSPLTNPNWNVTARAMEATDVAIPDRYNRDTYPNTPGATFDVVGYDRSEIRVRYSETRAFLYLIFDTANPGVFFYEYVPVPPGFDQTALNNAGDAMGPVTKGLQQTVIRNLNTMPNRTRLVSRRIKPGAAPIQPARHPCKRLIQREVKETFDLDAWQRVKYRPWREQAQTFLGSRDEARIEQADALRRIRTRTGITKIDIPKGTETLTRDLRRIEHWEAHGMTYGRLRKTFGSLYVRVIDFYEKVRKRFSDWAGSRTHRTSFARGSLGTAARVAFNIARHFVGIIARRTLSRLMDAFQAGMQAFVQQQFSEQMTAARTEIQPVIDTITDLETAARQQYEQLVEEAFKPYKDEIDFITEITNVIGDVSTIVNLARVAICLGSCGLPPGIGCLWGCVGQIIGNALISEMIESCWFQEDFLFNLFEDSAFINALPDRIATVVLDEIRDVLPESLRPLVGDLKTLPPSEGLSARDLECRGGGKEISVSDITDHNRFILKHGEDRVRALMELLVHRGVMEWSDHMWPDTIDMLDRFLTEHKDKKAEDFRKLIDQLPALDKGTTRLDLEMHNLGRILRGEVKIPPKQPDLTPRLPEERGPRRRTQPDIFKPLPGERRGPSDQPNQQQGGITVFEF
jgi:hypothetical protein